MTALIERPVHITLGEILVDSDGRTHQVIAVNASGKLVTVVRHDGDIDFYQDMQLTDRDTPPPHARSLKLRQSRTCDGCGKMITGQCSVCYKRRLRRGIRESRQSSLRSQHSESGGILSESRETV